MTRLMIDTTEPSKIIGSDFDAIAGYTAARWPSFDGLRARFPDKAYLSISARAEVDADVLDIEPNDATPEDVPGWLDRHQGNIPWLYTNRSLLPAVKKAAGSRPYLLWLAHPNNVSHICTVAACGFDADATQYQWLPTVDYSLVSNYAYSQMNGAIMPGAIYYPPADRTTQWYGSGNATVAPNKILWHDTEGDGWPAYSSGATAPNLTYNPWTHKWRQHFPLNATARALANGADGYATNRKGVVQIEIIATNGWYAPLVSAGHAIWNLDDQALNDLHDFSVFMNQQWGVPLSTGVSWPKYPAAPARLNRSQYEAYRGHLAHMHAPDQNHSDTGNLNIQAVLSGTNVGEDVAITQDDANLIASTLLRYDVAYINPTTHQVDPNRKQNLATTLAWWEHSLINTVEGSQAELQQAIVKAIADDPDADVDPTVVERAVAKAFDGLRFTTEIDTDTPPV